MFLIKVFLEISEISQENTCIGVLFNKVADHQINTYFEEHLRMPASDNYTPSLMSCFTKPYVKLIMICLCFNILYENCL